MGVEILFVLIQPRPTPNCWTSVHHELHMNAAKQGVSRRVGDVLGPGSAPGSDIWVLWSGSNIWVLPPCSDIWVLWSCPLANLIWMRTPGVILLNWIHTEEKKFWLFFGFKRWNGKNLLGRGSGPGCGKGNSSQGIPETNLVNKRIKELRGWEPAKGCSWRFPATLCRQVFLPHKSTRPFAVEDTLDNRCRLDFLRVNGT